jgi:hypothetical protein
MTPPAAPPTGGRHEDVSLRASSPYLAAPAAAAFLGVSLRTLHERARLRQVPHRRPPYSRRLVFLEHELAEWLDGAELEARELPGGGRVVKPLEGVRRR